MTWTTADYRRDASDILADHTDAQNAERWTGDDEGGYWSACEGLLDCDDIRREEP